MLNVFTSSPARSKTDFQMDGTGKDYKPITALMPLVEFMSSSVFKVATQKGSPEEFKLVSNFHRQLATTMESSGTTPLPSGEASRFERFWYACKKVTQAAKAVLDERAVPHLQTLLASQKTAAEKLEALDALGDMPSDLQPLIATSRYLVGSSALPTIRAEMSAQDMLASLKVYTQVNPLNLDHISKLSSVGEKNKITKYITEFENQFKDYATKWVTCYADYKSTVDSLTSFGFAQGYPVGG